MIEEALSYDKNTGVLTWKTRPLHHFKSSKSQKTWNTRFAGKEASCKDRNGYIQLAINGKMHLGHRVAWKLHTGKWPENPIDHRNGNRSDNKIQNLRTATPSQQNQNRAPQKKNKSGVPGVWFSKNRWEAHIGLNRERIYIGRFRTLEEAIEARKREEIKLFGEFALSARTR